MPKLYMLLTFIFVFVASIPCRGDKQIRAIKPTVTIKKNVIDIKRQVVLQGRSDKAKWLKLCEYFKKKMKTELTKKEHVILGDECDTTNLYSKLNSHAVGFSMSGFFSISFKAVNFGTNLKSFSKEIRIQESIDNRDEKNQPIPYINLSDFKKIRERWTVQCEKKQLEIEKEFGEALVFAYCSDPVFDGFGRQFHGSFFTYIIDTDAID